MPCDCNATDPDRIHCMEHDRPMPLVDQPIPYALTTRARRLYDPPRIVRELDRTRAAELGIAVALPTDRLDVGVGVSEDDGSTLLSWDPSRIPTRGGAR